MAIFPHHLCTDKIEKTSYITHKRRVLTMNIEGRGRERERDGEREGVERKRERERETHKNKKHEKTLLV